MFQAAVRRGVGQLRGWRVDLRALRLQRAVPLRPVLLLGYRRVLVGQLQACLEPLAHPLMAHLDRLGYHQRGVIDHDTSSLSHVLQWIANRTQAILHPGGRAGGRGMPPPGPITPGGGLTGEIVDGWRQFLRLALLANPRETSNAAQPSVAPKMTAVVGVPSSLINTGVSNPPMAAVPIHRLSMAPNVRPCTSCGTRRCRSVSSAIAATVFVPPRSIIARSANSMPGAAPNAPTTVAHAARARA